MIQIQDTIISFDVLQKKFKCDLTKCKGACCIHGDSGAPLEQDEALELEKIYPLVKPFMRKSGIEAIEKVGNVHLVDSDGDTVTVLVNNKECSFVIFEDGIAKCAIEKAYFEGKISFRKPISCHLYPVRVKRYTEFKGVNYDKWEICKPAVENGEKTDSPLYIFLKDSLVRKFGEEWYKELLMVNEELKRSDSER